MLANQNWTAYEWQELAKEQQQSGKSQRAWCIAEGLNYRTFLQHARKQKSCDAEEETTAGSSAVRSKEPAVESARWLEVTPEKLPAQSAIIRIEYGGFTVTSDSGLDAYRLTEVLSAVKRACC